MSAPHRGQVVINQTQHPMHILCFGAGAIGTYIGGSLALAGHQVVFLERPGMASQLRSSGLKLILNEEQYQVSLPVMVESLVDAFHSSSTGYDAAIVAMKAFDTAEFAVSLQTHRDMLPPLLSLQNGVDNEAVLDQVVGIDHVIPGTVTSAIGRVGAGEIILERLRGVGVTSGNPVSERLVTAMNEAGLKARAYENGGSLKWSKLITNLLANATSAILDMTPSQIYSHPGLVRLEALQIKETLQVMRRLGMEPVNLPGTPLKILVWGIDRLPTSILGPLLRKAIGGGRGSKMPSFHIDLYQGRGSSEVSYLNGAVAKHGAALEIDTPVNRQLTTILEALTKGDIPLDTYRQNPEKLLGTIQTQ